MNRSPWDRDLIEPPAPGWIGILGPGACALLCLLGGWASQPAPAAAQVPEAWTHASTVDPSGSPFSARLQAMGSLQTAVEAPQDRISTYGFSKNPAGLLSDEDSSTVEVPWRYQDYEDGLYGYGHTVIRHGTTFRTAIRSNGQWVLGFDAEYGGTDASRQDACPWPDDCRFIRDFDIQYPSYYQPVPGVRSIGAGVSQVRAQLTYGRAFLRKLALGGRIGYRYESEDRETPNPYDLNVNANALEFTGGALYGLRRGSTDVTLAGMIGWTGNHVIGTNETPYSEDKLDWNRPQVAYGGQILVRQASWARGIVDVKHRSHNGEEVTQVNWAPEFFLNPLPINVTNPSASVLKQKWTSALTGLRRTEIGTRWMFDVPRAPVHVGVLYKYHDEDQWIHPAQILFQTFRELSVTRLGYDARGGVSLDLPEGKGLVATEAHVSREARSDHTGALPEIGMSEQTYHFGVEYRAASWLPVRAGFVAIRRDWNRDDAFPPGKGTRVTAGLGYFWGFLKSQIDASYSHEHVSHAPGDPSGEVSTGDQVSLLARYVF